MSEIWGVLEHTEGILHQASGELLGDLVEIASRRRRQP